MENRKYLNEEKYQKTEKKILVIAVLVLIIGLCLGGFLIYNGIAKPNSSKVEVLKEELESKKKELENKGVVYDFSTDYTDGESYDLKIITEVLDPSFSHCSFSEYKDNSITKEYCSVKNSVGDFASTSSIMLGIFISIATCMIFFAIFTVAKRRSILAFNVQQVMPVAKEGIEEMSPTIGNVVKEITKGIKEGLKDEEK